MILTFSYANPFCYEYYQMAMKACPYRADFYTKLGSDQGLVQQDLSAYLAGLRKIVVDIQQFYEANKL